MPCLLSSRIGAPPRSRFPILYMEHSFRSLARFRVRLSDSDFVRSPARWSTLPTIHVRIPNFLCSPKYSPYPHSLKYSGRPPNVCGWKSSRVQPGRHCVCSPKHGACLHHDTRCWFLLLRLAASEKCVIHDIHEHDVGSRCFLPG